MLEYKECMNIIQPLLQDKDELVIFDVGANINNSEGRHQDDFTRLCLETFDNIQKIWAFEPVHFQHFEDTYASNSKVELVKLAVGNECKKQTLFCPKKHELSSFYYLPQYNNDVELVETEINVLTIDLFCKCHNIKHIDLLKLDIEGAEYEALLGTKELLSNKSISVIQWELSHATKEAGYGREQIHQFLNGFGYEFIFKTRDNNQLEGEMVYTIL